MACISRLLTNLSAGNNQHLFILSIFLEELEQVRRRESDRQHVSSSENDSGSCCVTVHL